MGVKTTIQRRVLDPLQFRYDVFPSLRYQPLPWLGMSEANRGTGTRQRWEVIRAELIARRVRTAVDVGCNVGFFCFAMAELDIAAIGVDIDDKNLRIAGFVKRKLGARNVALMSLEVTPATVALIPPADAVLLLSVWHHWVRMFGLESSTRMLAEVWEKTRSVLFFETGELEMSADYRLPEMLPDPQTWLATYLRNTCAGAHVQCMGLMKAFGPGGSERRNLANRHLFCLAK